MGPIRGAGKYILALVTDYSSQFVWKAQSHISLLDQQDLPISQLSSESLQEEGDGGKLQGFRPGPGRGLRVGVRTLEGGW